MRKLFLASLAVAALATAAPAAAQNYPPQACTFTSSGSLATPGETILVQGSCAPAGVTVTVTFTPPGLTVLTTKSNAQGLFSGSFVVPKNTTPGIHTLTARAGVKVLGTTRMNVLARFSPPESKKGTPWAAVGVVAAVLVALLMLVLWLNSRRSHNV